MSLVEQLRNLCTELYSTFLESEWLVNLLVTITMIIFWTLLAFIVLRLVRRILLNSKKLEKRLGVKESREQYTVRRLLNNIIQFFFFVWIAIMILGELGLDILPLLAGAGVLAFAIGFGAQELIKDVIAGTFLILEGTFRIGDYVEIGTNTGTVIDVGLRRIVLLNWKGEVITINNGDIRTIKNSSLNPSVAVIEFRADYNFDLQELESNDFQAMLTAFKEKHEDIVEMPAKTLLIDLNDGLKFVIHIKTKARKHVAIEREFRKELLTYFQTRNIEIVVPVVVFKSEE